MPVPNVCLSREIDFLLFCDANCHESIITMRLLNECQHSTKLEMKEKLKKIQRKNVYIIDFMFHSLNFTIIRIRSHSRESAVWLKKLYE